MSIKSLDMNFADDNSFWQMLNDHIQKRKDLQRMVLSSLTVELKPQVRTMILRSLDSISRRLYFYTDSRSPKLEQWRQQPFSEALAYSHEDLVQLRFSGTIRIVESGDSFEQTRTNLKDHQYSDYTSILAPGSDYNFYKNNRTEKLNFAIIQLNVEQLEVLVLQPKAEQHLRWLYRYQQNGDLIEAKRLMP